MGYLYRPKFEDGRPKPEPGKPRPRCTHREHAQAEVCPGCGSRFGRTWWAQWYVNGHCYRESTGVEKETEARRFLKDKEGRAAAGQPVLPRVDRIPYEEALLHALTATRKWSLKTLRGMCQWADRDRLRAAGDPLPGPGPFTLYRGVAGRGPARRIRGISWTASLERARWFAERSGGPFGLADPGVYRSTVPESRVVAYVNDRQEEEFIVLLQRTDRVERVE